jgi:hypothetical protein
MFDLRLIKAIVAFVVVMYVFWRQIPSVIESLVKLTILDPFRELTPLTPTRWRSYARLLCLLREQPDRGSRTELLLALAVIYLYVSMPDWIRVSW